jgi:hypothetical protein
VVKVKRHHKAEYARLIARCALEGIARRQAGGHAKPREASLTAKRRERSLSAAAEAVCG